LIRSLDKLKYLQIQIVRVCESFNSPSTSPPAWERQTNKPKSAESRINSPQQTKYMLKISTEDIGLKKEKKPVSGRNQSDAFWPSWNGMKWMMPWLAGQGYCSCHRHHHYYDHHHHHHEDHSHTLYL